jgi:hypothetical protein
MRDVWRCVTFNRYGDRVPPLRSMWPMKRKPRRRLGRPGHKRADLTSQSLGG